MAKKPHSSDKIAGGAFSCHLAAYLSCKESEFVWFLLIPLHIVPVCALSPEIFQAIAVVAVIIISYGIIHKILWFSVNCFKLWQFNVDKGRKSNIQSKFAYLSGLFYA